MKYFETISLSGQEVGKISNTGFHYLALLQCRFSKVAHCFPQQSFLWFPSIERSQNKFKLSLNKISNVWKKVWPSSGLERPTFFDLNGSKCVAFFFLCFTNNLNQICNANLIHRFLWIFLWIAIDVNFLIIVQSSFTARSCIWVIIFEFILN